jgi:hypothetical protein
VRLAANVTAYAGATAFGAGLWGLWGWPAAALFAGVFLLFIATGLTLKAKSRP